MFSASSIPFSRRNFSRSGLINDDPLNQFPKQFRGNLIQPFRTILQILHHSLCVMDLPVFTGCLQKTASQLPELPQLTVDFIHLG